MATLTIKPTAAGNDVQIKSGDGNTTHATFGDTSTVNMSAGTISGGTIASAVTFPAGHIIKTSSVWFDNSGTQVSITANASWTEISSGFRLTHQASSATNILLMTFSIGFNSPNSNQIYHGKFYNHGGSADITLPGTSGNRTPSHWVMRVKSGDINDMHMMNMYMRHVPGTASITYSPYFWSAGADAEFFQSDLSNNEGFMNGGTFIIHEIQS